ncbi:MAG: hypothetical protein IJR08_05920, partial [Bacilli bacterium]|nr:hypothetical protein [Bacilli bacterium]
MIIKNDRSLKQAIQNIISTNNVNMNVADVLTNAFMYVDAINPDEVKQYIKEGCNENEAIYNCLFGFLGIDKDDEESQNVLGEYVLNNLKKLNPKDYLDNPYVTKVKKVGRKGKYALKYIDYAPYQLFAYDDIKLNNFKEYSQIGYFDNKFSYLALTEGNNIWMSLNPNEIETMKPYINKARGNVLVLGLGMGYVPFMLSLKNCVKSITIIEKDQEIINLFNELIYSSFENKEKIKIIKGDAIEYARQSQKEGIYDYVFADLWHSPEDGLPLFVSLKRINKNIDCWLEVSLFALLRRCMITLLEEQLHGLKEEDYKFAKTYT